MIPLLKIVIICYNEEVMLPFTLKHYGKLFAPGSVKFLVYNNMSTDRTKEIALEHGCEVIDFETHGMNDTVHAMLKSQAAMDSEGIWTLCIDTDECCLITAKDLYYTEANVIQFQGWEIFDNVDHPSKTKLMGCKSDGYSKPVLIRTGQFQNIDFAPGAHSVSLNPVDDQDIRLSKNEFNLLHFKHWKFDYSLGRSKELAERQSTDNLEKGHSFHFALPYERHLEYYENGMENRELIIDERLELLK